MQARNMAPGVKAFTRISGVMRPVTIVGKSVAGGNDWIVRTEHGNQIYRTPRQLRPVVNPDTVAGAAAHRLVALAKAKAEASDDPYSMQCAAGCACPSWNGAT